MTSMTENAASFPRLDREARLQGFWADLLAKAGLKLVHVEAQTTLGVSSSLSTSEFCDCLSQPSFLLKTCPGFFLNGIKKLLRGSSKSSGCPAITSTTQN